MSEGGTQEVFQSQDHRPDDFVDKPSDRSIRFGPTDSTDAGPSSGPKFEANISGANASASGGSASASYGRKIAVVRQKSRRTREVSAPQPVYVEDIGFSKEGGGNAEEVLVKNARTRVRVNRLKNGQPTGRHLDQDKKKEEKKVNLTIRMMLGVRVAVGRQSSPLADCDLTEEDFEQVDKYTFPPAGNTGRLPTPSHKLNKTFKFRDYAPKVFKKLRELYGIDESSYTMSVAGNYEYLELITNSKSGSFFFFSHDQRYIIKAMKTSEAKFLQSILPMYYEHHLNNPDSLLIRFCGMYMVKNSRRKIPFIVMVCVDGNTTKKIHLKFDLKGSSVNRSAKEGEKVLKDNDLSETHGSFHLGHQRKRFLEVARKDAEFLRSVNVMDYSMLASIHDTTRSEPTDRRLLLQRDLTYHSAFFTFADEAQGRTAPAFERIPLAGEGTEDGAEALERGEEKNEDDEEEPAHRPTPRSKSAEDDSSLRFRKDGGLESDTPGENGIHEVYYMGIIDILQQYTRFKHAETYYKSLALRNKRDELSCVNPELYCERFCSFLETNTD